MQDSIKSEGLKGYKEARAQAMAQAQGPTSAAPVAVEA